MPARLRRLFEAVFYLLAAKATGRRDLALCFYARVLGMDSARCGDSWIESSEERVEIDGTRVLYTRRGGPTVDVHLPHHDPGSFVSAVDAARRGVEALAAAGADCDAGCRLPHITVTSMKVDAEDNMMILEARSDRLVIPRDRDLSSFTTVTVDADRGVFEYRVKTPLSYAGTLQGLGDLVDTGLTVANIRPFALALQFLSIYTFFLTGRLPPIHFTDFNKLPRPRVEARDGRVIVGGADIETVGRRIALAVGGEGIDGMYAETIYYSGHVKTLGARLCDATRLAGNPAAVYAVLAAGLRCRDLLSRVKYTTILDIATHLDLKAASKPVFRMIPVEERLRAYLELAPRGDPKLAAKLVPELVASDGKATAYPVAYNIYVVEEAGRKTRIRAADGRQALVKYRTLRQMKKLVADS